MLEETHTGTVRCFSDETGEGYIISDDGGEDLFVCFTDVAASQGGAFKVLVEGARVSYDMIGGGVFRQAENVRRIG